MSFSQLLCSPGLLAINRPKLATVSLLIVLVTCLASLSRLTFEDDISKSFSSGSSYSQDYAEFVEMLGYVPKQIVVLAEASEPLNVTDYDVLRNLAFEFELTDGVSSVFSVASVSFPANHADYPNAPLLPFELDPVEIDKRLVGLEKIGIRTPISKDTKSALFVISLNGDATDVQLTSIVSDLRGLTTQIGGGNLRYSFTGEDLIGPEMVRALQHDLIVNNLVGCLLAFVLALLVFGNLRLVVIALLPALFAAIFSLSTFAILNFPVNVLNTVIPILILILALADSIHLTLHFRDESPEKPVRHRSKGAMVTIGPACALTAITTAIAFAVIGLSDNQQLKELAIIGAVSVLMAYVAVIVSFALLTHYMGATGQRAAKREWVEIPSHWGDLILGRSKMIYAVCAVIVCISIAGVANTKPWFNLDENLPTDSTVRLTNQKIAHEFGGIYRIWSELDVSGNNALETRQGWDRLVSLTRTIEAVAPNYPVVSLATLSRWQGQPGAMLSKEDLENLPSSILAQLHSEKDDVARVITITPEAMLDKTSLQIQTAIEESATVAGATRNIGLPVIMRHESISVINQLFIGLGLACLMSVVLIAGFYKWPMLAAALLIPNAVPLAVAAASLTLTRNGELTPTAMLALTVAFGIAIDDSIHLVNRFVAETKPGRSAEEALRISIQRTGKAMLVTTILICAGMSVTMLSSFETVRLFGGMLILTFITAFLADILLLPCLLRALAQRK